MVPANVRAIGLKVDMKHACKNFYQQSEKCVKNIFKYTQWTM